MAFAYPEYIHVYNLPHRRWLSGLCVCVCVDWALLPISEILGITSRWRWEGRLLIPAIQAGPAGKPAGPTVRFLGPVPVPPLPLQLSPVCVFTCDPQIPPTHPILPFLNNDFTDALFSVLPRESTKSLQMIQNALSLNTYRRIWSYETNPSLTALASSSCQIRL